MGVEVREEALDAAARALGNRRPGVSLREMARLAIEAALPHLVEAPTTDRRAYDVGRDAVLAEATHTPIPDQGERDDLYHECCQMWGGHSEDCAAGES